MLSRLKRFGVPVEDLVSVYVGYVRPTVEYASPVWHSSIGKKQTQQIERIPKKACYIILGSNYTTYNDALDLTGLQTLEVRRLQLCYEFAQKCTTSDRYSDWFPRNINHSYSMSLRCPSTYQVPKYRTNRLVTALSPFFLDFLTINPSIIMFILCLS